MAQQAGSSAEQTKAQVGSMIPELPPSMGLQSGKTMDEILADMNKHPLFMTELEDNDDVAALQALAYEGTPYENGLNFKEQGNECFLEKRWADAKEFYGKGITVLAAESRRRARGEPAAEGVSDDPEEVAKETSLLEQLYVNRAACHLELRNYRSCTLDCAGALRLNPRNVKAFYRSAKALLALDKIDDAEDACDRGLEVDSENAALKAVARDVSKRAEELEAKQRRDQARAETTRMQRLVLRVALKARGIRTRFTDKPPEMEDVRVQLVPNPDDPRSSLSFPTVLLYPLKLESDFIKAFNETETLEQHFGYVFPLPWDKENAYKTSTVECYMETVAGGLIKFGKKVPLLKVLSTRKVEVVDDLLKIFVLPKAKAESWVEEFKMKKMAEKGEGK